jgi:hypothetical protein
MRLGRPSRRRGSSSPKSITSHYAPHLQEMSQQASQILGETLQNDARRLAGPARWFICRAVTTPGQPPQPPAALELDIDEPWKRWKTVPAGPLPHC